MDKATFNKFREIIYKRSGIYLGESKIALADSRIGKRMKELGINDYKEYLQVLLGDRTGKELLHLINAISTNVTSFFREPDHFDFIRKVFSGWLSEGKRRFRFWSAACSTGEEPYSLAITLMDVLKGKSVDMKILATDISTKVLASCIAGKYSEEKVATVPQMLKKKYFEKVRDNKGAVYYCVKKVVKDLIVFTRINLSVFPFPMQGPFDIVLCRNVMIYFDSELRKKLLGEIYRLLKPMGYLIVGHAESISAIASCFKMVKPSIYVKM